MNRVFFVPEFSRKDAKHKIILAHTNLFVGVYNSEFSRKDRKVFSDRGTDIPCLPLFFTGSVICQKCRYRRGFHPRYRVSL